MPSHAVSLRERRFRHGPRTVTSPGVLPWDCFGGLNVLDLARSGADVQAVVSMHGTLTTPQPANKGDIKTAVLAVHGAADPIAPKAERDAFEAEMTSAGVTIVIVESQRFANCPSG
jgi:dienelactone hydrolase